MLESLLEMALPLPTVRPVDAHPFRGLTGLKAFTTSPEGIIVVYRLIVQSDAIFSSNTNH